ncbi:MAG: DUF3611 family protein [Pseudomonadota bacterium]|nr:DUF3611 family protein [Pseudomonadota bacterium]
MFNSAADRSLSDAFRRTGRVGFWAQVIIGSLSLVMAVSAFVFDQRAGLGTRGALAWIQYLTIASLLVLLFTTVWFYRYARLAGTIADPVERPSLASLNRTVWTGVAATALGLVLSMLIMVSEAIQLFIYFLRAPQAGVPVVQTSAGAASWVSAGDILSLAAVIAIAFVEVVVLVLGLWLLFRTTSASAEYPDSLHRD